MTRAAIPGKTELHPAQGGGPVPLSSGVDFANNAKLSALVERLSGGDRTALRVLYESTVPTLLAFARTVLPNDADAEEVICDVYTQVWQSASHYDPSRGTVMTWLLMICRARAIDRYRDERSRACCPSGTDPAGATPSIDSGPDAWLDALQEGTAVRAAIARLAPVRRHLLGLAFFRGLSHEEIATVTQLALGTVKSHIRRALAALRKTLQENGHG